MTVSQEQDIWRQRAEALCIRSQAFIGGRFTDALDGRRFDCVSPIDGRVVARVAECSDADVDRAVSAARQAFDDRRWCGLAPARRKAVLLAFAQSVEDHAEELALLETIDMGKPISDSLSVDVPAAARCLRWYAEAVDKVYGEVAPTADNVLATITREPLGVVAVVVPWNFPMIMTAWKIAPALAAGNSVVVKPAEQSPLTALRLAELAAEAGLPDGVLNVVPGFGPVAGRALGLHGDVNGAFFTGSTEVGKLFLQYSGQSNMKRIGLECGGKSAQIILESCSDLDTAAQAAAGAIFFNQGEMCTAGSRLVVQRSIHDKVMERLVAHASTYRPGDPLAPKTTMGALVDEQHTRRVLEYVDIGRGEGARLVTGGARVRVDSGGCYVEPSIFDGVSNAMRIAREEIFGPVLSVITVADADEAVAVANDSDYGLAAAVWSDDVNVLHQVTRRLKAGVVYANCYDADDITVPFGGFKQSGIGRDKSLHALEKYTELKSTWLRLR
ncbi:aldehyde dehydrogenase [Telmatospirillum siberiense]|uniref:Aldehyde dehydrogenase PuuC n=1 Tax=Telmatospirillum siberiense TaxID=382514 RepID=A0A2N3PUY9_9PROT|nr:aldehyde dehydrogenase [Telmatospirillum siberiense]PKU24221.1 aldehyde dehydrogenase PuuC [Telmatospirillum siberiense]